MEANSVKVQSSSKRPAGKRLQFRMTSRQRWGIGSVLVFLLLWEVNGIIGAVNPGYVSQPTRIVEAGIRFIESGNFFTHVYVSMVELFAGFSLAVICGLLIGTVMGRYRLIGGLFDPIVMALYATPRVALVPLFVVWFGVGMGSKIFVVFIGAVFPVLVNTMTGIRQVDPLLIRAARSYGANARQLFAKVLLPGALPAMMTGVRLGWGRGILGFVIGEMYVSMQGLGNLIKTAGNAMRTDQLFFLIVVVALIGYIGTAFFQYMERKLSPWKEEGQGQ